ncbi:MAG TPA: Os1348 family NHLP clan protein [Candidatus Acidoferrales bacterium]|nr:Os1348 family NHLP clan protein [Candidatus Acidoferrales bacterium]
MSKEALAKVIQRSISDGAFRRQLATDPTGALRGYELSGDETAAIRSGDSSRLTALGVEQRMSKAFAMGTDSTVSNTVSSDLGASWTGALTGGDSAPGGAVLTPGDGAAGSGALVSGDTSDTDPMVSSGNEAMRSSALASDNPIHSTADEDGYLPSIGYATTIDAGAQHDVIVSDDGASGASTPSEATGGPNISE